MFDYCMLHPELDTGVFGVDHVHGLQTEDVDLEEIAGTLSMTPSLDCDPSCLAPLPSDSKLLSLLSQHQSRLLTFLTAKQVTAL